MLSDPQTITIDGTANTLPRVLTGTKEGKFQNLSTSISVETTAKNSRIRTVARLAQQKVTADPLVATTNIMVNDSIALTINRPSIGYSDSDVEKQVAGFIAWLTASSNANLKKIIAGEN